MTNQILTYKYRIYPSSKQRIKLIDSLKICKTIYNELLALSIDSYKYGKVSLTKFDYNNYLKDKYSIHSQVIQNVSDRVNKAFSNFFRRVKDKRCKDKGFPRFKSKVCSLTYPQTGFKFLSDKRLHLSKIGNIPIVLHRIPKGKMKTLTIKVNNINQWYVFFSCEIDVPNIKHPSTEKIGLDVGLEKFVTLSNKESISNPRYLIQSEKRLKILQRRLSKKVKGSKNRLKSKYKLAKQHLKVSNQRSDFLHKLSKNLVSKYSTIVVEDLNISNMNKNHRLAKHINDASWNSFIRNLEYKALIGGSKLIKVNPRNTSKMCSECGNINDKLSLSDRTFICPKCNFTCNRDLNASINIKYLGINQEVGTDCSELNAYGDLTSKTDLSVSSKIVEIGTINDS